MKKPTCVKLLTKRYDAYFEANRQPPAILRLSKSNYKKYKAWSLSVVPEHPGDKFTFRGVQVIENLGFIG